MRSLLRLVDARAVEYLSVLRCESEVTPGVAYTIRKMSFAARMELSRRVRDLSKEVEFRSAGSDVREHLEANVISHQIDDVFLSWGLVEIEGLLIDGELATPALLLAKGSDALAREIVNAIRAQCGLDEEERKN